MVPGMKPDRKLSVPLINQTTTTNKNNIFREDIQFEEETTEKAKCTRVCVLAVNCHKSLYVRHLAKKMHFFAQSVCAHLGAQPILCHA